MEAASRVSPGSEMEALEAQVRECFGRVVYSHKAHEKAADQCLRRLRKIKLWQIVLSAVTTGGLLVAVFGGASTSQVAAIVSAFLSTALLALNTYTKDIDPGTSAERHKETAAKLWLIRESYLSLITDLRADGLPGDGVRRRRDALQESLGGIYAAAPRTTPDSYVDASTALKHKEELTFTTEEIDKFLPEPLRLGADRRGK